MGTREPAPGRPAEPVGPDERPAASRALPELPRPMPFPDGLAQMPPGPELAVALAGLDPKRLTGPQLVDVVAAHTRQIAHQEAQRLAALHELGYAPPGQKEFVVRERSRNPYAAVEGAFAAAWTGYRCEQMMGLAEFVSDEVPRLNEALAAGRVDLDKAKIFYQQLAQVTDRDVSRDIVDKALAKAGEDNTATLRSRLHRLVAKADPEAVRKRRERDHRDRFFLRHQSENGLATLVARFCDEAASAAAYEHVDSLAKATKAAGDADGRTLNQLRHDIALNLLGGVDAGTAGTATAADRQGAVIVHIDLATLVGIPALLSPAARHTVERHGLMGHGLTGHPFAGDAPGGPGCWLCWRELADLTNQPGEIAGLGPVTAHIARQTVAALAEVSTWRYAVQDGGQVVAEGALPKDLVPELVESMRKFSVDASAGPDGRAHYKPTAAQIAFVRARDRRCQAPGCRIPAHRCQVDHRLPWHLHGPTFVDDLYCLCARHHRAKDDGGHRYRPIPGGIEWITATGHRYTKSTDRGASRQDPQRPGRGRPRAPGRSAGSHPRSGPSIMIDLAIHDRR